MATVMLMEWPGVTQGQYDKVMKLLDLDTNVPVGGMFHVAGFSDGSLRVLDVWESQQAFDRFQQERLMNAVMQAGITTAPNVQFFPAYNIYVPNLEAIRKAGTSSLPTGV